MNLIQEYEFDSLPYIDKDYDIPAVRDYVHSLIVAEMRSFAPGDYLAHMPYPELKFKSPALKHEMARVTKGGAPVKVDMSRYEALPPEGALEGDLQAWRKSLSNVKAQFEHQSNRQLNLELCEAHGAKVWLHHNHALEGIENYFRNQTEKIKTRIELVNLDRKTSQEAFQPILLQLNYKRDQLVFKCMQIERRCEELEAMCSRDEVTAAGMEAARGGLKRDAGEELEDAQSKRSRVA